eukprot:CAMPEP_0168406416 /NCGR_PEP_ID=MMETSP0228-20121227/25640_1 /TAXON_ID=133427 /ORGANISM="Protoceratium reticulatum, Strain CCCM 535 (=CCMP 1889)" /LENGTH=121 /DNA_ID=CAMNT_0008420063 /DNA_START=106 /DNA_END=468 /DNA_ORIENTATION=-
MTSHPCPRRLLPMQVGGRILQALERWQRKLAAAGRRICSKSARLAEKNLLDARAELPLADTADPGSGPLEMVTGAAERHGCDQASPGTALLLGRKLLGSLACARGSPRAPGAGHSIAKAIV